MKLLSGKGTVSVKTGSVSISEARQAARAAKAQRPAKSGSKSPAATSFRERHLGHFGTAEKSPATKQTKVYSSRGVAKRSSGRKTGAKKKR